jgi:hypothetical protein
MDSVLGAGVLRVGIGCGTGGVTAICSIEIRSRSGFVGILMILAYGKAKNVTAVRQPAASLSKLLPIL